MKQTNNDSAILGLISKMQVQLFAIDQKLNSIMNRINPEGKPLSNSAVAHASMPPKPQHQPNLKTMYKIICADCNKESEIPFKPSEGRPVYCKECFGKRKSGHLPPAAKVDVQEQVIRPDEPVKSKSKKPVKKAVTLKKKVVKKKVVKKK